MFRTATVLTLLSAPLVAQTASFATFGNACAFSPPPMTVLNLPRIGATFSLEVLSGGSGGYDGATGSNLLVGVSNTSWLGVPLPWTQRTILSVAGAGSCGELSISADWIVRMPDALTRRPVTTSFRIPHDPSLIGTSVYFQPMDSRINTRGMLGLTFGVAGEARLGT